MAIRYRRCDEAGRDGYLWFCGRRKQIIIDDGSNVTPQEVEDALIAHPAVASAGVVGVPDHVHGENVYAFVTFKEDAVRCAPAEVIGFARLRVGYKAPEDIFVLDQMPLNPSGKVDRAMLRKMAETKLAGGQPAKRFLPASRNSFRPVVIPMPLTL